MNEDEVLHYALLDINNFVTNIITIAEKDLGTLPDLVASNGASYAIEDNLVYKAQIQGTYDGENFLPHKLFDSWVLKEERIFSWEAPVPYPSDGLSYIWDEETLNWVELVIE